MGILLRMSFGMMILLCWHLAVVYDIAVDGGQTDTSVARTDRAALVDAARACVAVLSCYGGECGGGTI